MCSCKEIMNIDELSEYLNISKSFIYKLTSQKNIPHYCPTGKLIYFSKREIIDWVVSNKNRIC